MEGKKLLLIIFLNLSSNSIQRNIMLSHINLGNHEVEDETVIFMFSSFWETMKLKIWKKNYKGLIMKLELCYSNFRVMIWRQEEKMADVFKGIEQFELGTAKKKKIIPFAKVLSHSK